MLDTNFETIKIITANWIKDNIDNYHSVIKYSYNNNTFTFYSDITNLVNDLNIRAKRMELNKYLNMYLNPNKYISFNGLQPFEIENNKLISTLSESVGRVTSIMHTAVFGYIY